MRLICKAVDAVRFTDAQRMADVCANWETLQLPPSPPSILTLEQSLKLAEIELQVLLESLVI